ncbi:hypothetical protein CRG98_007587 [Punica granatum]|uniref:Uncharacterized protein n=1 Tax=Punica granatum TaxID=22663 RepID=A0A2I0KUA7_PUNGR|nr:hypothetical protein CRG98_007587 [Punica granatum]
MAEQAGPTSFTPQKKRGYEQIVLHVPIVGPSNSIPEDKELLLIFGLEYGLRGSLRVITQTIMPLHCHHSTVAASQAPPSSPATCTRLHFIVACHSLASHKFDLEPLKRLDLGWLKSHLGGPLRGPVSKSSRQGRCHYYHRDDNASTFARSPIQKCSSYRGNCCHRFVSASSSARL